MALTIHSCPLAYRTRKVSPSTVKFGCPYSLYGIAPKPLAASNPSARVFRFAQAMTPLRGDDANANSQHSTLAPVIHSLKRSRELDCSRCISGRDGCDLFYRFGPSCRVGENRTTGAADLHAAHLPRRRLYMDTGLLGL